MHTDPSVVLCVFAVHTAQVSSACVLAFSSSVANLHLDFCPFKKKNKVYFSVDSILRCYWAPRELYIIDR